MNVDQDVRDLVLSTLPYSPSQRAELEAKSTSELLIIFLNWRSRFVTQVPRAVHMSRALTRNPSYPQGLHADAIDSISQKVRQGDDLTPHLSTRVLSGYEPGLPGHHDKRTDLDLLLNDWNVHHLHLSNDIQPNGFVKRTGALLFAAFAPRDAYFIDILDHKSWSREHIAHVLIDEFPQSGLVLLAPGVVGVDYQPSDSDRGLLRSAGVNTGLIERRGKYYFVGRGGLSSAGTSAQTTMSADRMLRELWKFEARIKEQPSIIVDALRRVGAAPPADPDVHVFYDLKTGRYGAREGHTNAIIPVI